MTERFVHWREWPKYSRMYLEKGTITAIKNKMVHLPNWQTGNKVCCFYTYWSTEPWRRMGKWRWNWTKAFLTLRLPENVWLASRWGRFIPWKEYHYSLFERLRMSQSISWFCGEERERAWRPSVIQPAAWSLYRLSWRRQKMSKRLA
jgi:hypothetical protein